MSTYPVEVGPSQRFRVGQFIPQLRERGHTVAFYSFYTSADYERLFSKGNILSKALGLITAYLRLFLQVRYFLKWDTIVIQREVSPIGPPLLAYLFRHVFKKRLIYDFDDAIWLPNYTEENKNFHWLKAYWKTAHLIKTSHEVMAGNDFLAEYASSSNERVHVIPTVVDTHHRYNPTQVTKANSGPVTIGWTGSISTITHLESLDGVLSDLMKKHPFRLKVVSNKEPQLSVPFTFVKWNKENEVADLMDMDIGLMPLPDNEWTRGKCGFKAIQYMSMGIPAVASPVGVNTSLISHQVNGYLCPTLSDWSETLEYLITHSEERSKVGEQGRRTIVDRFSVASQIDAIERIITGRDAIKDKDRPHVASTRSDLSSQ